jgi:3-phenylpropionate/trans-cinnamate dioxygenase ferredoxin reductase component
VSARPQRIVVIGGGPAGTFAAIAARQQSPAAAVTLLTDEPCEPYEKPPLSKAVLLGRVQPADALIAGPGGLAVHNVHLEPDAACAMIDRAARSVKLDDGRQFPYDALVVATGSVVREIPHLPLGTPRVHYLRTETDARMLGAALRQCNNLLVVGGGLIGLEVAASAAELGVSVTVVEMAPRVLARVCDEETSAIVHETHRQHGVRICVDTALVSATSGLHGVEVVTSAGEVIVADLVVVGTGAAPNVRVAAAAGLAIDDGIVVDECCRTSDPAIFAAGDVVRFPGPRGSVRLENWRHAQDQGAVAGRNAAGASDPYVTVPSFWSEQYDLYIQGVGWEPSRGDRASRPLAGSSRLTFETSDGLLVYATGINAQRDMAMARRLIERRVPVDAAALADPAQPLAALLKGPAPSGRI